MKETVNYSPILDTEVLPRVLIIGQTFTSDTGGGITLSNLFYNWPPDKLAIAVESKEDLNFTTCSNYYRIGYDELKMPFPFYLFQRKTKSGMVTENKTIGEAHVKQTSPLKENLKRYFDLALHYMGLFYWIYGNQNTSPALINWIKSFDPDIIYYQPNSYKSLDFVSEIHNEVPVPLISHVMDDWFSFAVKPSPLKWFWQKKLNDKVKKVFAATKLHLSICSYMSEAYLKRYGHHFIPFHNSVDVSFWLKDQGPRALNTPVHILYAGRIGYGLDAMLLKMANVIEDMAKEEHTILFEIQTKDQTHPLAKKLSGYKNVKVSEPIAYNALPRKFSDADVLLIPCDFDGPGVKFIKYSMPTKVSEYMATGTPILVIGPPETALVEYAKQGWAQVCQSDNPLEIKNAVNALITSETLRNKIAEKALSYAVKNHDRERVMHQFRSKVMVLNNSTKVIVSN
jgi:glycosyltransferase involved in cell wall biosynthesis